jgi:hypothetical protein
MSEEASCGELSKTPIRERPDRRRVGLDYCRLVMWQSILLDRCKPHFETVVVAAVDVAAGGKVA